MTRIFHRFPKENMPVAVRGDGVYLIDAAGKRYIDGSGGAAVSCIGHGHPAVIAAMKEQIEMLEYAHTSFFTSPAAETLADMLIEAAPPGMGRVYITSSGSEAVETALKLGRQYFLEVGQPQRCHFVARLQSFHGNTLGALAVGGNLLRRRQFDPLLTPSHHISPCYAYRGRRDGETEEEYGFRVANELEAKVLELGPGTVIGFVAETVVGATLGTVPAVPGYFRRIREICDRYGMLLILDEIMCGMGRTGTLFACEQEGVRPDIVTLAKGLGGGYQPIGATVVSEEIYRAFLAGSGAFQHGHTYLGHPVACAAAVAVQRVIREQNLIAHVRDLGKHLSAQLAARFGDHPFVGDIRGRGLFQSIELVADRATKRPFDPALRVNARIKEAAMERGLVCYPMGGTVDGRAGDHVMLAPPFIAEERHIDEILDKLTIALDDVLKSTKEAR